MWGLALAVQRAERAAWRKKFGSEYTGLYKGRAVRLAWGERVVGHVCRGADPYSHLECFVLVQRDWVWLRSKA